MLVNNEIGVIQPIAEIGEITRAKGIILHVDAAQATGKVAIDLEALKVDLMSFSAHKTVRPQGDRRALRAQEAAGAPRGADARRRARGRGLRSGTLATHQIVGMGEGVPPGEAGRWPPRTSASACSATSFSPASGDMEEIYVNGDLEHRVPHNLNVSFNFVEGESLIMGMKELAVSSGSACTSASLEPSYVLRALGRNDELAHSSIRFTLGRFTTEADIEFRGEDHPGAHRQAARDEPALGNVQGRRGFEFSAVGRTLGALGD